MNRPANVKASALVMPLIHAVCERDNDAAPRFAASIQLLRACARIALARRVRAARARAAVLLARRRRVASALARQLAARRCHVLRWRPSARLARPRSAVSARETSAAAAPRPPLKAATAWAIPEIPVFSDRREITTSTGATARGRQNNMLA